MVCPLGPAVILTARPPERLFHLVFESPWWKGLGAESEEKREPVSDIDTGVVVSLKVLDPDGRLEKRTNSTRRSKRTTLFDHLVSVGGTVRPSIRAVAVLITSSNLVACTTGKSAGFAPLRMRPA